MNRTALGPGPWKTTGVGKPPRSVGLAVVYLDADWLRRQLGAPSASNPGLHPFCFAFLSGSAGSDLASGGQADHLVARGGDHGH
jgi:hypothetical protein